MYDILIIFLASTLIILIICYLITELIDQFSCRDRRISFDSRVKVYTFDGNDYIQNMEENEEYHEFD